tara:strand:- start:313 stop:504 length:192 start_codon:yes stop_codon:yes gene_type:complete
MSGVCAHCGKGFTCGCQKLRASDGQTIHKSCSVAYEKKPKTVAHRQDALTQKLNQAQNNIIRR